MPGEACVTGARGTLCRLRYGRPGLRVRAPITGRTVSVLDSGEVVRCTSRIDGRWGHAGASLDVPANSPLAAVGLVQPVAGLVPGPVRAEMGLGFRPVGQARSRSNPSGGGGSELS